MSKKEDLSNNYHRRRVAKTRAAVAVKKHKKKGSKSLSTDNPTLKTYFRDVNEYELLSRDEEAELFEQYHRWRDNKAKCGGWATRKGKAAYEKLISANLKLVIKIANEFPHVSLPIEDRIAEGNCGLIVAVEKFKPNKKSKLSTYASYWIRQSILRGMAKNGRTIRIPEHQFPKIKKINKFIAEFHDEYAQMPSVDEIIENTKINRATVTNLFASGVVNVVSLDKAIGNDAEDESAPATVMDVTEDHMAVMPDQHAEKDDDFEMLLDFLGKLKQRERWIIMRRFGMGNFDPETLDKIAQRYDISRERIRQIQWAAMKKMRQMSINVYDKEWADFTSSKLF